MCKIKFVEVSQIMEDDKAVGMKYLDSWMVVSGFSSVEQAFCDFKENINLLITENRSMILCRDDAKRFAKTISSSLKDQNIETLDSKLIFRQLKEFLYNNYEVKRIIMNPRTLEYYPLNKAFIINKL